MTFLSQTIISFFKFSLLGTSVLLFSLYSHTLQSADESGQYLIMGLGNSSCEAFMAEDELGKAYYLSWLAGYMTAYNFTVEETYSIMGDSKTITQIQSWLIDYCTINSDENFESAVRGMMKNLKFSRSKVHP